MKFTVGFLGAMGVITLCWAGLIFLQTGRPTLSSQWIADAYQIKTAAAQRVAGKKIVIVAGSNALFGIDSKAIEEAYALPVVNFGVNAGPLLPYILLKSKTVLKRGDIVIMPLEYHCYTYDGIPNTQMIDQIWSRDPSFFRELSWAERWQMIWLTPLSRLVDGFLARGGERAMCGPYGYRNIDERGDQTHTSAAEAGEWAHDWDAIKNDLPRRYGADAGNAEGWRWLENYASWAKRNGVRLIIIPSTMMWDESYVHDPAERRFYAGLQRRIEAMGVPFAGNPYDSMFPRRYYFNTDFHLTGEGREFWTRRIIDDLESEKEVFRR